MTHSEARSYDGRELNAKDAKEDAQRALRNSFAPFAFNSLPLLKLNRKCMLIFLSIFH